MARPWPRTDPLATVDFTTPNSSHQQKVLSGTEIRELEATCQSMRRCGWITI
ncbi:hypothetical protein PAXRUDRAFT_826336 [Paxillus rubicundulus Ve08.2h10]|uniref:Uncharacterized protein n=1 Tax=Paxillus rubicundulus Ve08.2h10 TaxID=930991 RepID=A0A0D0DEV1_9AGAM|nr:hypothetical protein PAXRUDRAFT_826336 [Paxillus rubicundulus Ve08.2h10]